jgi:hypothetical protein
MAGIDIGVHRSDRRSRVGKLNRQGSPHLRGALRSRPGRLPAEQPRPRRLPRPQGTRPQPHPRVIDDRSQARPSFLARVARARACRPGARPDPLTADHPALRFAHRSTMTSTLPASSRSCCGSPPKDGGPAKTERPESLHPD